MKILIINGPNLNMLGQRDQDIYGSKTLADIEQNCIKVAQDLAYEIEFFQSNEEGTIVDKIQSCVGNVDAIVINAAAYTHTSVAIRDALEIFDGKKIELHLSNIYKREEFRHNSLLSGVCDGVICGLGAKGYEIAILGL